MDVAFDGKVLQLNKFDMDWLLKDENGNYFQPKAYKDANNIDTYKNWLEQGLKDFYSE